MTIEEKKKKLVENGDTEKGIVDGYADIKIGYGKHAGTYRVPVKQGADIVDASGNVEWYILGVVENESPILEDSRIYVKADWKVFKVEMEYATTTGRRRAFPEGKVHVDCLYPVHMEG
jgi:hypothetical protein